METRCERRGQLEVGIVTHDGQSSPHSAHQSMVTT